VVLDSQRLESWSQHVSRLSFQSLGLSVGLKAPSLGVGLGLETLSLVLVLVFLCSKGVNLHFLLHMRDSAHCQGPSQTHHIKVNLQSVRHHGLSSDPCATVPKMITTRYYSSAGENFLSAVSSTLGKNIYSHNNLLMRPNIARTGDK